eukprot:13070037-Ditylum_brightwellii.AAC.1
MHVDLVWASIGFRGGAGEMPNYFKIMMPVDTPALEALRTQMNLEALLWYQIITQINLSIKATIENLDDKLETAKMDNFGNDVRKFNTWFIDQHNNVVREIGKEGCMEYL